MGLYGCFRKWWYPQISILIGISIINHPFWDTPILETPIWLKETRDGSEEGSEFFFLGVCVCVC